MIKVGLTGGIGSGKSVVASLFGVLGIPVYIADTESKRLVNSSPLIRERLTALFGDGIYGDGRIDRRRLASLIFGDAALLKRVNTIIHPEVCAHFLAWAERQTSDICVIETAILFESGFDREVDVSVLVYAPLALRTERVLMREQGMTREEAAGRMRHQSSDEEKREMATYVLYNHDGEALIPQAERLIAALRLRESAGRS
ncbi:MAG: dephospho-CoA kinase [Tannerellaceae bacterium]|jgi:dephospho-CoA kinase|nr:dephospho-CoA kinase [Tannerellaceae bacterium]